ncbi:hypothetical protein BH24ACT22_BH24ACT22_18100 [soil metagenome]
MAVVVLGIAASNALLPPVTQSLIGTFGWRTAYVILGLSIWALLIPTSILIVRNRPEAVGLHPDGSPEPVREPGGEAEGERGSWEAISSLNFWLLAVPLAAIPFAVTALVFHQISILGEQGISATAAAGVFIPFAVASAAATALSGFLIERLGPRQPLYVSMALLLTAVVGLQLVDSPLTAVLYALVLGAGAGFQGVVAGVVWAHYYGRQGLGKVQGPATMVMISAAALAPLPLAALRSFSGDYALGLAMMSAIPIACTAMLYLFDPKKARREI